MTDIQKNQIMALRQQGYGYATIAKAVGLKKDTVVAFCRRTGLTGRKASDNSRINLDSGFCLQCGLFCTRPQAGNALNSALINAALPGGIPTLKKSTAKPYTASSALTAANPLQPTATPEENTVPTPATLRTATKAVMSVNNERFRSEMNYLTALSIAKSLRKQGLLTKEEYAVIDTNLRAEFEPTLGTLLSENDLIIPRF